jgi:leucyl aminopeptidase
MTPPKTVMAMIEAHTLLRDLINTPAEDMMPEHIVAITRKIANKHKAKLQVYRDKELLKKGYPTVYAVGRASSHAPQVLDLRWGDKKHPKLTLVGKGVCFDSGGLDIKPASGMLLMKKDMGGAAHVLALASAIMHCRLPIQLRVIIPVVENAINGNAFHPSDIITTRKGLTVEVTNTDAEGRLILCDALTAACEEKTDLVIDVATLTGAARVALGTDIAAMFTAQDKLAEDLLATSKTAYEYLWRLPLHEGYRKEMESPIAHLRNAELSGGAGAITAALFLKAFVPNEVNWVHFDIYSWNFPARPGRPEGGDSSILRTLFHYCCERFGKK